MHVIRPALPWILVFCISRWLLSSSVSNATDTVSEFGYGTNVPFGGYVRPPSVRLILSNTLAGRYNPLGLFEDIRFGVQKALYRQDRPIFRDNFLYTGLGLKFTPTSIKVGAALEMQPISIFTLRTSIEWARCFRTFNSFQSFASPSDDYSEAAMSKRTDDDLSYAASGIKAVIEPSLQFRLPLGRKKEHGTPLFYLAFRDKLSLEYNKKSTTYDTSGRRDSVGYDSMLDTVVSANGWAIQNHLDLLLMTRIALTFGVRYTVVIPIYERSDFRSAKEANAYDNDNGQQRLGPVIAYTFFDRAYARFNRPTVLLVANWYLDHRWRTGAETAASVPYLLLAFTFQSDFLNGPPLP